MTDLALLFDELNRDLFGGRLPAYTVEFGDMGENLWMGFCDPQRRLIVLFDILREAHPDAIRLTLLHEMAHIERVPDGENSHGPAFRRRLRALMDLDERQRGVPYSALRRRLLLR